MTGIIGANVRRLRLAAGMSQAQLGEAMGVHQSTVAYWENVFSWSPTADDMRELCAIFSVEPNDFYQDGANQEVEDENSGEDYDDRGDFDDIVCSESPVQWDD